MLELSVVLATYNRSETLRKTLDCLAAQTISPDSFEVIVIDDGSPDDTGSVVEALIPTMPYQLSYLRHDNSGPGYTQNRGIRAAKGDILLIMADDVWLDPGALRAHLDWHRKHPEPEVAILGRVIQSPLVNDSAFIRKWEPNRMDGLEDGMELPSSMFWANNITCKRDFLLEHEMFSEEVGDHGPHHHHDSELGYRLAKHGLRIFFSYDAWGYHYHPYTLEQAIERWYQRGLNHHHYMEIVPDPEVPVLAHLLNWETLGDHLKVLRGLNTLQGPDKKLSHHLLRKLARLVAFNRVTAPLFWRKLIDKAEESPALEEKMSPGFYHGYLFFHFERGIRDARRARAS